MIALSFKRNWKKVSLTSRWFSSSDTFDDLGKQSCQSDGIADTKTRVYIEEDFYGNALISNLLYTGPIHVDRNEKVSLKKPLFSVINKRIDVDIPDNVYNDPCLCELERIRAEGLREVIMFVLNKLKFGSLVYGGKFLKNVGYRLMICDTVKDLVDQLCFDISLIAPAPTTASSGNIQFYEDFYKRLQMVSDTCRQSSLSVARVFYLLQIVYCHPFLDSTIERSIYHSAMVDSMISLLPLKYFRSAFDRVSYNYSPQRYADIDYQLYNNCISFVKDELDDLFLVNPGDRLERTFPRLWLCELMRGLKQHTNQYVVFEPGKHKPGRSKKAKARSKQRRAEQCKRIKAFSLTELTNHIFPVVGISVLDLFHVSTFSSMKCNIMFDARHLLPESLKSFAKKWK